MLPLLALAIGAGAIPVTSAPSIEQMQQVAKKSVPYLEKEGMAWIKERKCVSCHQVPFLIWGLEAMHSRGMAVDREKLGEWRKWSIAGTLEEWGTKKQKEFAEKNVDTIVQLLLARGYAPASEPRYQKLKTLLLQGQQTNGSWNAGGQLPQQSRPKLEITETSTLWALHALSSLQKGGEPDPVIEKAIAKAGQWLGRSEKPFTTELILTRMLYAQDRGQTAKAEELKKLLLAEQNRDGGWSWQIGGRSDPLATGQALYALRQVGVYGSDPAIARAWTFLRDTQQSNGSWRMPSTKAKRKGKVTDVASYWGSGWAIVGLSNSLPK